MIHRSQLHEFSRFSLNVILLSSKALLVLSAFAVVALTGRLIIDHFGLNRWINVVEVRSVLAMIAGASVIVLIKLSVRHLSRSEPRYQPLPDRAESRSFSIEIVPERLSLRYRSMEPYWNVAKGEYDPQQLVGRDNVVALAKVYLACDAELRLLAVERDVSPDPLKSTEDLANDLAGREFIPPELGNALREILGVAYRALHGDAPSSDLTSAIVLAATQTLAILKQIRLDSSPTGGRGHGSR